MNDHELTNRVLAYLGPRLIDLDLEVETTQFFAGNVIVLVVTSPESLEQVVADEKLVSLIRLLKINFKEGLDEYIGKLTHVQKLDLSDNDLTSLPESIGNLTNLEVLNLRGNDLHLSLKV